MASISLFWDFRQQAQHLDEERLPLLNTGEPELLNADKGCSLILLLLFMYVSMQSPSYANVYMGGSTNVNFNKLDLVFNRVALLNSMRNSVYCMSNFELPA
eukprot:3261149-Heterocapsa_arctica.AAC.1